MTDDKLMAEQLNLFFCSVFTQEDTANVPEAENLFHGEEALENVNITEEKVRVKLRKLRPDSAPGPDKLLPRVLQHLSEVLAYPLTIVYTRSLQERI